MNVNRFIEFICCDSSKILRVFFFSIRNVFLSIVVLPKNLSDCIWTEPLTNFFAFGISHLYYDEEEKRKRFSIEEKKRKMFSTNLMNRIRRMTFIDEHLKNLPIVSIGDVQMPTKIYDFHLTKTED